MDENLRIFCLDVMFFDIVESGDIPLEGVSLIGERCGDEIGDLFRGVRDKTLPIDEESFRQRKRELALAIDVA